MHTHQSNKIGTSRTSKTSKTSGKFKATEISFRKDDSKGEDAKEDVSDDDDEVLSDEYSDDSREYECPFDECTSNAPLRSRREFNAHMKEHKMREEKELRVLENDYNGSDNREGKDRGSESQLSQ